MCHKGNKAFSPSHLTTNKQCIDEHIVWSYKLKDPCSNFIVEFNICGAAVYMYITINQNAFALSSNIILTTQFLERLASITE